MCRVSVLLDAVQETVACAADVHAACDALCADLLLSLGFVPEPPKWAEVFNAWSACLGLLPSWGHVFKRWNSPPPSLVNDKMFRNGFVTAVNDACTTMACMSLDLMMVGTASMVTGKILHVRSFPRGTSIVTLIDDV